MQRRSFLKTSVTATGSLMVAMSLPTLASRKNGSWTADVLTEIHRDGTITFTLTKHEMGQGTGTGVPMVFCEELGANWETLKVIQGDFDRPKYGRLQGNTGGSSGVRLMWNPLREQTATLREVLKEAAARKWNVERSSLETKDGFVWKRGTKEKIGFENLIDTASEITISKDEVVLKDPKEYYLIGTHQTNLISAKVAKGHKLYAGDFKVPGMVYAAIERCPVFRGRLKSYNDTETRKIPGVIDVIKVPRYLKARISW